MAKVAQDNGAAARAAGRSALLASRGAGMAVHSAAGLAIVAASPEAARLLRTAEGLCRAASAVLAAACSSGSSVPRGGGPGDATEKPQKARKKKKKAKSKKQETSEAGIGEGAAMSDDSDAVNLAPPGGSVVFGDLSELGLAQRVLVVDPVAPAASSSSATTPSPRTTALAAGLQGPGPAQIMEFLARLEPPELGQYLLSDAGLQRLVQCETGAERAALVRSLQETRPFLRGSDGRRG